LEIEVGDSATVIQLPVKITRFVNRPHTYEVNDIEQQVQQAATKALAALGIERQS
jgi:hypothetical protein